MRKQYKFIKHSKTISKANLENKAKLTDTKTLKLADSISAHFKRGLIMV